MLDDQLVVRLLDGMSLWLHPMMRLREINLRLGNLVVPFQGMLESEKYMLRGL